MQDTETGRQQAEWQHSKDLLCADSTAVCVGHAASRCQLSGADVVCCDESDDCHLRSVSRLGLGMSPYVAPKCAASPALPCGHMACLCCDCGMLLSPWRCVVCSPSYGLVQGPVASTEPSCRAAPYKSVRVGSDKSCVRHGPTVMARLEVAPSRFTSWFLL